MVLLRERVKMSDLNESSWTVAYFDNAFAVAQFFNTLSPNQIKWSKMVKDFNSERPYSNMTWVIFYPVRADYMLGFNI